MWSAKRGGLYGPGQERRDGTCVRDFPLDRILDPDLDPAVMIVGCCHRRLWDEGADYGDKWDSACWVCCHGGCEGPHFHAP
jgi:hypothetical protein